ncbi:MAG: dienelactone hydrolase family protein [Chloroflexota bacterium]
MAQSNVQTEWHTLEKSGQQPELKTYIAKPGGQGPWPALIVIHEAFGLDEHIQDVTRRFAGEGYLAVAPDLFWLEPAGRTITPDDIKELFGVRFKLPPDKMRDPDALIAEIDKLPTAKADRLREVMRWSSERDGTLYVPALRRLVDWARGRSDSSNKVGVTGFCMGGGLTLALSFDGADIDAAAPFYGQNPPLEQASQVKSPLLLMYGRKDPFIMPGVPALIAAIVEAELDFAMHVYEEAGHAFLNDARPEMYSEAAARNAWPLTLAFFERHLGG